MAAPGCHAVRLVGAPNTRPEVAISFFRGVSTLWSIWTDYHFAPSLKTTFYSLLDEQEFSFPFIIRDDFQPRSLEMRCRFRACLTPSPQEL